MVNRLLPAEILGKVFDLLSHSDLKSAVLVCRWWREVGESPLLWTWACLKVDCSSAAKPCLPELRRPVARMEVRCTNAPNVLRKPDKAVIEEVLLAAARHPWLREVVICADLSSVDPELLAWAVIQLERVEMLFTRLGFVQILTLLTAITTEDTHLKSLFLGKGSTHVLAEMDSGVLAAAIANLVEVRIANSQLIPEQVEAIFAALEKPGSRLRKLRFGCNDLASVDPRLLASVVNKMEEVELEGAHVTSQQITAICTQMTQGTSLRALSLKRIKTWTAQRGHHDIALVDPSLLARAVAQLEEVKLPVRLGPDKLRAIFAALNAPTCRLRRLNMSGVNLSSVDAGVMADAVNMLETADIRITHLTSRQITEILTRSLAGTSLKELYMPGEPRYWSEVDVPLRRELVVPDDKRRRELLGRVRRVIPRTEFHRQCQCADCPRWSF